MLFPLEKKFDSAALILGMFRSGTSMVANIISELGAFVENDSIKPDIYNRRGYWESAELSTINKGLLDAIGYGEFSPPPLFFDWESSRNLEPFNKMAVDYVGKMTQHHFWGCKQPSTTITLPFWRRHLPVHSSFILCFRNPLAVSKSMMEWNLDPYTSSQLWIAYSLSALAYTSGERRLLVFYEDFALDRDKEVERIADFLDVDYNSEAKPVYASELQHHPADIYDLIRNEDLPWGAKLLYYMLITSKNDPDLLQGLTDQVLASRQSRSLPTIAKGEELVPKLRELQENYTSLANHPYVRFGRRMKGIFKRPSKKVS